ncbi:MAG TPA: hypothetical protein VKB19_05225 [Pedobacter sp.]|nr:hypothetical protein [Pedobacter sp.]
MDKRNQLLMTPEEFLLAQQRFGNFFDNSKGVQICFTELIGASKEIHTGGPSSFTLCLEAEDVAFFNMMNISSSSDVDQVGEEDLWRAYRNGYAYLWANIEFLSSCDMIFTVKAGRTYVESKILKFTDEVNGVWDNLELFKAYIRENIQKLYIAAEEI